MFTYKYLDIKKATKLIVFYALFGLSKSAFSTCYFGKLAFRASGFYVFSVCHVMFIELNIYIIIVYISAIWPLVILFCLEKNYFYLKNIKIILWKFGFWRVAKKQKKIYFQRNFEVIKRIIYKEKCGKATKRNQEIRLFNPFMTEADIMKGLRESGA